MVTSSSIQKWLWPGLIIYITHNPYRIKRKKYRWLPVSLSNMSSAIQYTGQNSHLFVNQFTYSLTSTNAQLFMDKLLSFLSEHSSWSLALLCSPSPSLFSIFYHDYYIFCIFCVNFVQKRMCFVLISEGESFVNK